MCIYIYIYVCVCDDNDNDRNNNDVTVGLIIDIEGDSIILSSSTEHVQNKNIVSMDIIFFITNC